MKLTKKILVITSCYNCNHRDTMACTCDFTKKKHPPPNKSIPKWCPLLTVTDGQWMPTIYSK